ARDDRVPRLGSEDDLERRSAPWDGPKREAAVDRGRTGTHVLQSLAGDGVVAVEAGAVVLDRDEALAVAPADDDLGARRLRVLANVGEALLHDAEDLDLLVWREMHGRVHLELDVERTVGGEDVDVAAQSGVERRRAARGGQREDGEARLLLREQRSLLQPGQRLLD